MTEQDVAQAMFRTTVKCCECIYGIPHELVNGEMYYNCVETDRYGMSADDCCSRGERAK